MSNEILLVGSIPLPTEEQVFKLFGAQLGEHMTAIPDGEPVGGACPPRQVCELHLDAPAGKVILVTALWSAQRVRCDDAAGASPGDGSPVHPWWRCRRALSISGPGAGYTGVLIDE